LRQEKQCPAYRQKRTRKRRLGAGNLFSTSRRPGKLEGGASSEGSPAKKRTEKDQGKKKTGRISGKKEKSEREKDGPFRGPASFNQGGEGTVKKLKTDAR